MPFCPNCGNRVGEEDSFCFSCGANLEEARMRLQEGYEIHKPEEPEFESPPTTHTDRPVTRQSWITSVGTLLSRTNQMLHYLRTMRKRRLYEQWVEASDLPPTAIPQDLLAESVMPETGWKRLKLVSLYVLLGVSVSILLTGLILLILHSC